MRLFTEITLILAFAMTLLIVNMVATRSKKDNLRSKIAKREFWDVGLLLSIFIEILLFEIMLN